MNAISLYDLIYVKEVTIQASNNFVLEKVFQNPWFLRQKKQFF